MKYVITGTLFADIIMRVSLLTWILVCIEAVAGLGWAKMVEGRLQVNIHHLCHDFQSGTPRSILASKIVINELPHETAQCLCGFPIMYFIGAMLKCIFPLPALSGVWIPYILLSLYTYWRFS